MGIPKRKEQGNYFMSGEHHEFKVAHVNHISKGSTPTSGFQAQEFPKGQVQLDQHRAGPT